MFPPQLLLEVENINCIAVDWKEGAKGTYVSAVNNIRVLGAEVAYFITTLQVKEPALAPGAAQGTWGHGTAALGLSLVQDGQGQGWGCAVEIQLITLIIGPERTSHSHKAHK